MMECMEVLRFREVRKFMARMMCDINTLIRPFNRDFLPTSIQSMADKRQQVTEKIFAEKYDLQQVVPDFADGINIALVLTTP